MGLRGRHSGVCGVFHMVILSNTDYTIHTYLFLCRLLLMESADSPYILLGQRAFGPTSNVPSTDIYPNIQIPLCTSPLRRLLSVLQVVLKHNFTSGLSLIGGTMMALHYRSVVRVNSGCPMMIAAGQSETGKSTAIKSALSLTGIV